MADVVPFALHSRVKPVKPRESGAQMADILFFTGVRYEREIAPVADEPQPRRRRRTAVASKPVAAKRIKSVRQPA